MRPRRPSVGGVGGLVLLLSAACSAAVPGPSSTLTPSEDARTAPPSVSGPNPSSSGAPPPAGLVAGTFADVVADLLTVRSGPALAAPIVERQCPADAPPPCGPALIGQETPYPVVYLLDGPVDADGYAWYRAATEHEQSLSPELVGWVASGDAEDDWLLPREVDCPEGPIELTDVTFTGLSRLMVLHCLGSDEVTLRGYYTAATPGEPPGGDCVAEPGWLICTFGTHFLRTVAGPAVGDANHLQMHLPPDLGPMPPRPGWIEVTGRFDHPAAAGCPPDFELTCRLSFVVTAARTAAE